MRSHYLALVLALLTSLLASVTSGVSVIGGSKVKVDSDGGYSGIVFKIGDQVPEEKCQTILQNIKVRHLQIRLLIILYLKMYEYLNIMSWFQKLLEEASLSLYDALDKDAYFKSVQVVVPNKWRDTMCKTVLREPKGDSPYRRADIQIGGRSAIYGDAPYAQQSAGCGHSGDLIRMPWTFLEDWNVTWQKFGDPSKLFVREWAKYRYGVFDEAGFAGDQAYPNYFVHQGQVMVTGTSNVPVEGMWVDEDGKPECDPTQDDICHFRPFVRNDAVNCSLGFMHFLSNVRGYCDKDGYGGVLAPTKHNVLCQGRSAAEVIRSHDDFANRYKMVTSDDKKEKSMPLSQRPTMTVVREPEPQYVLVMETTEAMDAHGQWRWVNRAAQKFIRYDLPDDARVAIVGFSNTSEIRSEMTRVRDLDTRARLADSVPDKYHLSKAKSQNLLAGVQTAVHQVLGNDVGGAHIIIVSRGLQV